MTSQTGQGEDTCLCAHDMHTHARDSMRPFVRPIQHAAAHQAQTQAYPLKTHMNATQPSQKCAVNELLQPESPHGSHGEREPLIDSLSARRLHLGGPDDYVPATKGYGGDHRPTTQQ